RDVATSTTTSRCSCADLLSLNGGTAPTHSYTLSLHDALPILVRLRIASITTCQACQLARKSDTVDAADLEALNCAAVDSEHFTRSEEHTSELQSRENLVCRLLLEKKKPHAHNGDGLGITLRLC